MERGEYFVSLYKSCACVCSNISMQTIYLRNDQNIAFVHTMNPTAQVLLECLMSGSFVVHWYEEKVYFQIQSRIASQSSLFHLLCVPNFHEKKKMTLLCETLKNVYRLPVKKQRRTEMALHNDAWTQLRYTCSYPIGFYICQKR